MTYTLQDYNLTVQEIAEILGYTPQRVRTLAQTRRLPSIKRFRQWLFCEQEVLETLKQLSPVAGSSAQASDPKRRKDDGIANRTSADTAEDSILS
jgi:hypothetical protein